VDKARNLSINLALARRHHGVEKAQQQPAAVAGDCVGGSEVTRGNRGRGVANYYGTGILTKALKIEVEKDGRRTVAGKC
jgi:hypothetical protein